MAGIKEDIFRAASRPVSPWSKAEHRRDYVRALHLENFSEQLKIDMQHTHSNETFLLVLNSHHADDGSIITHCKQYTSSYKLPQQHNSTQQGERKLEESSPQLSYPWQGEHPQMRTYSTLLQQSVAPGMLDFAKYLAHHRFVNTSIV